MTSSLDSVRAVDVMRDDVVAVTSDASVTEAWQVLFASASTHLLVVDRGLCVGVVDDRTIALEWPSGAFESRRRQVRGLCVGAPTTVRPSATVCEVARRMVADGRTAAVVVDEDGHPLGLVTVTDLVAALACLSPGSARTNSATHEIDGSG